MDRSDYRNIEKKLAPLLNQFSPMLYKKKAIIDTPRLFPTDKLLFIQYGIVEVSREVENGRLVLNYLGPGDFIGAESYISGTPQSDIYTAKEATEVKIVSFATLNSMLSGEYSGYKEPLRDILLTQITMQLYATREKFTHHSFSNVDDKVWHALQELISKADTIKRDDGFQVRATRIDIANMSGVSRETAGRTISRFAREGRIQAKGMSIFIPSNTNRLIDD